MTLTQFAQQSLYLLFDHFSCFGNTDLNKFEGKADASRLPG